MIVDILTEWNVLTATMSAWISIVSMVVATDVAVDVVPPMYRKHKARKTLEKVTVPMIIQLAEQAAKPTHDETMQLFVIQRPAQTARRRHAAA